MTNDFTFYQGDDIIPYFVITDVAGDPVDVSGTAAATWVAMTKDGTPIITKHLTDMSISSDPETPTVYNCIFVPLKPGDTGAMADVGVFEHELRIELNNMEAVVYPPVGETATFTVVQSLTWNAGAIPPAPRLERVVAQEKELKEEEKPPVNKLRRIPKLPSRLGGD